CRPRLACASLGRARAGGFARGSALERDATACYVVESCDAGGDDREAQERGIRRAIGLGLDGRAVAIVSVGHPLVCAGNGSGTFESVACGRKVGYVIIGSC